MIAASPSFGAGNRGPLGAIRVSYLTLDDAMRNKDAQPPRTGYVAVKIIDDTGKIYRERTAGQHIASVLIHSEDSKRRQDVGYWVMVWGIEPWHNGYA